MEFSVGLLTSFIAVDVVVLLMLIFLLQFFFFSLNFIVRILYMLLLCSLICLFLYFTALSYVYLRNIWIMAEDVIFGICT